MQLDILLQRRIPPLSGYWHHTPLDATHYIIGCSLKVQANVSYNAYDLHDTRVISDGYDRWQIGFHLEL